MADETTNETQGGAPLPPENSGDTSGSDSAAMPGGPADADTTAAPPTPAGPPAGRQPGPYGQRGGGRGGRGGGGGGRGRRDSRFGAAAEQEDTGGFEDNVVKVYRCATVVKGGRRFSFAALVVVGDRNGQVGVGYGKANEVPSAVEKATKAARRAVIKINLAGTTIPHQIMAKYGASKVLLLPAGEGTGVIAGGSVRSVMELAGIKDVLTKAYGSTSPKNLVKAAFLGLQALRSRDEVSRARAVSVQ
jgi:small subunit ribosomal protein S5